jgi:hypothetical protein
MAQRRGGSGDDDDDDEELPLKRSAWHSGYARYRLTFTGNCGPPVLLVEFALATLVVLLVVLAGMKAACVASESAMMPRNLIENFIVMICY